LWRDKVLNEEGTVGGVDVTGWKERNKLRAIEDA
jgi:hypothetical protein